MSQKTRREGRRLFNKGTTSWKVTSFVHSLIRGLIIGQLIEGLCELLTGPHRCRPWCVAVASPYLWSCALWEPGGYGGPGHIAGMPSSCPLLPWRPQGEEEGGPLWYHPAASKVPHLSGAVARPWLPAPPGPWGFLEAEGCREQEEMALPQRRL